MPVSSVQAKDALPSLRRGRPATATRHPTDTVELQGEVVEVTGSTFHEVVIESEKDVLVEFYTTVTLSSNVDDLGTVHKRRDIRNL